VVVVRSINDGADGDGVVHSLGLENPRSGNQADMFALKKEVVPQVVEMQRLPKRHPLVVQPLERRQPNPRIYRNLRHHPNTNPLHS